MIGYRVIFQKQRLHYGWLIGLGLGAYGLYSVLGCGCGEAGWCERTPIVVALVSAVGSGVLWAKNESS
jgi:hypothetical protein